MKMIKKKKNNNELLNAYQQATVNNSTTATTPTTTPTTTTNNNSTIIADTILPAYNAYKQQPINPPTQKVEFGSGHMTDTHNYNAGQKDYIKTSNQYNALVNERTSAMSNLNAANMQALKYANTAAQAGGYSTQGAANQNIANLQSAYLNQANAINTGHNQSVLELSNTLEQQRATESAKKLDSYMAAVEQALSDKSLNQAELDKLQQRYLTGLSESDKADAITYTEGVLANQNKANSDSYIVSLTENGGRFKSFNNNIEYYSNLYNNNTMSISYSYKGEALMAEGKLGNEVKDSSINPNEINVGQIVKYGNSLITKDKNGKIRYVDAGNNEDKLKESLGFN